MARTKINTFDKKKRMPRPGFGIAMKEPRIKRAGDIKSPKKRLKVLYPTAFPAVFLEEDSRSQSILDADAESMPSLGKKSSKISSSPMAGGSQALPANTPFKIPIKKVDKKVVWGQVVMFCPNPDLVQNFYVS
jgi:hypothetical protein